MSETAGSASLITSTVDARDVNHFSQMADEWWDVNGPCIALHSMGLLTVPWVRDTLRPGVKEHYPLEGLRILDVGCGAGIVTEPLARLGASVTGVDASSDVLQAARLHAEQSGDDVMKHVTYVHSSIEDLPNELHGTFDAIVAMSILEHVTSPELFINATLKALKEGGHAFFTTLNKTWAAGILGIWVAENVLRFVPRGTHQYEKFISPSDVQKVLEANGCSDVQVHGLTYIPFWNKWFWSFDRSITYAMNAVKKK